MSKPTPNHRTKGRMSQTRLKTQPASGPHALTFVVQPYANAKPDASLPARIVVLRPNPHDSSQDQLFLDQVLLPREAWHFDLVDHTLTWRGLHGGGHIVLHHDHRSGHGLIGAALKTTNVRLSISTTFVCDIAPNVGATAELSDGILVGLDWNPSSDVWKNSTAWQAGRLEVTYTVTPQIGAAPALAVSFFDRKTNVAWDPGTKGTDYNAQLTSGSFNGADAWAFNFDFMGFLPIPNNPADPAFPKTLRTYEDAAAQTLTGAMLTDQIDSSSIIYGLKGQQQAALGVGYYQVPPSKTCHTTGVFGVFGGRLHVNCDPVPSSAIVGNTLIWSNLSPQAQAASGLPAAGSLRFGPDWQQGTLQDGQAVARRLSPASLHMALERNQEAHPALYDAHSTALTATDEPTLSITGLTIMTPYQQVDGVWRNLIQEQVYADLTTATQNAIPDDMWDLIFPGVNKPTLSAQLEEVINTPVPGTTTNSEAWYQSLGTAVLTQSMAGGNDPNCANMNGPRAATWMQHQMAQSPIYQAHTQLLFNDKWAVANPTITQYLTDQATNTGSYAADITTKVNAWIAAITQTISGTDPDDQKLRQSLTTQMTQIGNITTADNLYWAFAYYDFMTSPAILSNTLMEINDPGPDTSVLTRMFNKTLTVLTSLDGSNYFARQYIAFYQNFITMNVLSQTVKFSGPSSDYNLIVLYLQEFVTQGLQSLDADIVTTAQMLQKILADDANTAKMQALMQQMRGMAESAVSILQFPYLAAELPNMLIKTFPDIFNETNTPKFSYFADKVGGAILLGAMGMSVYAMIQEYREFSDLKPDEQGELISTTCQYALTVLGSAINRGIRIYQTFLIATDDVTGVWENIKAFSFFLKDTSFEDMGMMVDVTLQRTSTAVKFFTNTTVETPLNALNNNDDYTEMGEIGDGESAAARAEFIAENFATFDGVFANILGPVFVLAGVGFASYDLSHWSDDSALDRANDITTIVAAVPALVAVGANILAATGLIAVESAQLIGVVCGPLAIVGALVGIGLAIAEAFVQPPNPVQEFVSQYVTPAGFGVAYRCSAIDYATPYMVPNNDPSKTLQMLGFDLTAADGNIVVANTDGSLSESSSDTIDTVQNTLATVWQQTTNGIGLTTIMTAINSGDGNGYVGKLLSVQSDSSGNKTVAFADQMTSATTTTTTPTTVTQTWLVSPVGAAQTTQIDGGYYLVSLGVQIQPVYADSKGNYAPSGAAGYLTMSNGSAVISDSAASFTLTMQAYKPTGLTMADVVFYLNFNNEGSFMPRLAIGSQTLTYALGSSDDIATDFPFATFDPATGGISQKQGQQPTTLISKTYSMEVSNSLSSNSSDSTSFNISVIAKSAS